MTAFGGFRIQKFFCFENDSQLDPKVDAGEQHEPQSSEDGAKVEKSEQNLDEENEDDVSKKEFLRTGIQYYFWKNEEKIEEFVRKNKKKISPDKKYALFFDGACKGNPGPVIFCLS